MIKRILFLVSVGAFCGIIWSCDSKKPRPDQNESEQVVTPSDEEQLVGVVNIETDRDPVLVLDAVMIVLESHGVLSEASGGIGVTVYVKKKDAKKTVRILKNLDSLKGHWREVKNEKE